MLEEGGKVINAVSERIVIEHETLTLGEDYSVVVP